MVTVKKVLRYYYRNSFQFKFIRSVITVQLAISTPGDIPQLSKQFFSVPFDYEILIDITPDLTRINSAAANYPWEL